MENSSAMRRAIALTALVATTAACSFFTEKKAVEVDETVSGLTFGVPGDQQDGQDAPELTRIRTGSYRAEIVSVYEADESRTDIHEGATFYQEIQEPPVGSIGYLMDDYIEIAGRNGRIRGSGVEREDDNQAGCHAVTEVAVQGRVRDARRFQLVVQETTSVNGPGCGQSALGPARTEENIYRVRYMAER